MTPFSVQGEKLLACTEYVQQLAPMLPGPAEIYLPETIQRTQYPLSKEYTLNYRVLNNMI